MKEAEDQSNLRIKLKHIVGAIVFVICISVITSFIAVKAFVPSSAFVPTTLYVIPTSTSSIMPSASVQPSATSDVSLTVVETPTQYQIPMVESNLLQNSGFENGLEGWTYSEHLEHYETTGITGKAFCSNQYVENTSEFPAFFQDSVIGFSQEIPPIDPIHAYFFSAWVKLNKAINVYARIDFVDGTEIKGFSAIDLSGFSRTNHQNNRKTTDGWVFVQMKIPAHFVKSNSVIIHFSHGPISDPPQSVDSTFCVDSVIFGKIVE